MEDESSWNLLTEKKTVFPDDGYPLISPSAQKPIYLQLTTPPHAVGYQKRILY